MDQHSKSLWERVCATVNRLGSARSPRVRFAPESPFPAILDLHGMTVADAYDATVEFLSTSDRKEVTVITGKSGVIRREFEFWLEQIDVVHSYSVGHDGGAFLIRLR